MLLNFLKEYATSVALVFSIIAGLVKFWQYVDSKRQEQKQKNFENYHKLVERLTAPLPEHKDAFIDVQKAAVFEMRNYPAYKKLTRDIFKGWIERKSVLSELMKDTLNKLN